MSKNSIVCKVHADPGHSWYAVSSKVIVELGIVNKISHYSYVSNGGTIVYLEEDVDARLFLETAFKAGYNVTIKYAKESEKRSPIRNYRHYTVWGIN